MVSRTIDARRSLAVLVLLVASSSVVHCAQDTSHDFHPGESRLLDAACNALGCVTTGTARLTTGPTSDSTGVKIGPGQGKVTITLPDFSSDGYDTFEVQALVSGRGKGLGGFVGAGVLCDASPCSNEPKSFLLESDHRWVTLAERSGIDSSVILSSVAVFIEVQDSAASMEIADVRYARKQSADDWKCSVAAVGARKR